MSAIAIIDTAPLGALIRYTDGSPKPPARFDPRSWQPGSVRTASAAL
nr:hypothetical protein [Roseovarius sp. 217]